MRASDYFGPRAGASAHAGSRFMAPLLQGRTARVIGDPSAPHSWAYLPDLAAAMVAVAGREDALGRVWVAPHAVTASLAELAAAINAAAGTDGRVRQYPAALLRVMGLFSPMMREVLAVSYQHTEPYVVDDAETRAVLGVQPTPFDVALDRTLAWVRAWSGLDAQGVGAPEAAAATRSCRARADVSRTGQDVAGPGVAGP